MDAPPGWAWSEGCLTVWGHNERTAYPAGKPWDRQPVSGKLLRKLGVSPGFATYRGQLSPKRLSTPPGWAWSEGCLTVLGAQRTGSISRGQNLGQTASFRQTAP